MYPGGTNQMLIDSPADWISPNPGTPEEDYKNNPSARYVGKVIVNDTDHLWGHRAATASGSGRASSAGLNVLFMEELTAEPDLARLGAGRHGPGRGDSRGKIDLARMVPVPELAQTGYLLADRGREYLAYQDGSQGEFWIDLKDAPGQFAVEWFDTTKDKATAGKPVEGGGRRTFTTPFPGPAVLYLKREGGK